MEDNDYGMRPPTPKAFVIAKTVIKSVFLALIIFIYGFFILRICMSEPEQNIIITQKTADAYRADPGEFVMYTQNPQIFIDEYDSKNHTGYNISIFNITYVPSAKQLQVTVRYNKSVFDMLKEKYGDDIECDEPFVFSLLFEDGTRLTDYTYRAEKTNRYYFRYLVFDNVDLEGYEEVEYTPENSAVTDEQGRILAHETGDDGHSILYETLENGMCKVYFNDYVYLDAYYIDDVDFENTPSASLLLINRDLGFEIISPKKYDINSIATDLLNSPYFIDNTDYTSKKDESGEEQTTQVENSVPETTE